VGGWASGEKKATALPPRTSLPPSPFLQARGPSITACHLVIIEASVVAASVDGSQEAHAATDIIPQVHLWREFLSARLQM